MLVEFELIVKVCLLVAGCLQLVLIRQLMTRKLSFELSHLPGRIRTKPVAESTEAASRSGRRDHRAIGYVSLRRRPEWERGS